ncbi:MAG: ribosomal-processing cysteine protease Prp [Clostridia bacterium]|nr:ribosomal-processing cysteine protease Prp [Clostridia bacterium]
MTKIVFHKWDNVFYGFSEHGHTGYGESGDDVLCAAISAMTMLIINTIR